MIPFYFTINETMPIMVVPDANSHMDGHPVLTYSYTLYEANSDLYNMPSIDIDSNLASAKQKNPDYLGTIFFDLPDKSFTYISDGMRQLSGDEVQETIEKISHYRHNPDQWRI